MNIKARTVRIWKGDTEIVFYFVGGAAGGLVYVSAHDSGIQVESSGQLSYEKAAELLTEHIREGYTVSPITPGY